MGLDHGMFDRFDQGCLGAATPSICGLLLPMFILETCSCRHTISAATWKIEECGFHQSICIGVLRSQCNAGAYQCNSARSICSLTPRNMRERERATRGDRVLFSSVGLWEGFLGVRIAVASASLTEGTRSLGLIFDSAASAGTMAAHRVKCFSSSFHAATAQMRAALDFPCAIPAFLKLLHTVMEPAGLYGSELWGLLSIPGLWSSNWSLPKFYGLADPLEVQRCRLIRQWLRLPASVPHLPLLPELGSEPLVHCYVRRAVRFYNCLVDLDVASVYRGVLRQNIDDALSTRSRAHNFVGALFQVLRILLPRAGGITRTLRNCLPLDATAIDEALSTRYTQHIQHLSQVERLRLRLHHGPSKVTWYWIPYWSVFQGCGYTCFGRGPFFLLM